MIYLLVISFNLFTLYHLNCGQLLDLVIFRPLSLLNKKLCFFFSLHRRTPIRLSDKWSMHKLYLFKANTFSFDMLLFHHSWCSSFLTVFEFELSAMASVVVPSVQSGKVHGYGKVFGGLRTCSLCWPSWSRFRCVGYHIDVAKNTKKKHTLFVHFFTFLSKNLTK